MEKSNEQIQFEKILLLLEKTEEDISRGGIVYFEGLRKDILENMIQESPDFFKENDVRYNEAPTINEFMSFVELNRDFTMEGFVTSPQHREGETRFVINGVSAPANNDNVANLYMWINDETNQFIEPTELDDNTGDIRAWWD